MEISEELRICADCHALHIGGDATAFDFWYSAKDAERRIAECEAGINALCGTTGYLVEGSDETFELDATPCDCCDTDLAGERYHVVVLHSREQEKSDES